MTVFLPFFAVFPRATEMLELPEVFFFEINIDLIRTYALTKTRELSEFKIKFS